MGEQELIFDLAEIYLVSVICSGCNHGIIFNVKNVDTAVPSRCPICQMDFGLIGEGLGVYRRFYHRMLETGHKVQFRMPVPKEG